MPSNLEEKCKAMTDQADRIEAKMDRLIELLEADAAKRTKKVKPFLSDPEVADLHQQYGRAFNGDLTAIDGHIAAALDHDAAKKAGNSGSWILYVQRWLKTEADKQPVKHPVYGYQESEAEREKWRRNAERIKELGLSRDL